MRDYRSLGNRYPPEVKAKVLTLYAQGHTPAQIRAALGVSQTLVRQLTKATGISRPIGRPPQYDGLLKERAAELYASGLTADEVAPQLGVSRWYVTEAARERGVLRRHGRRNDTLERFWRYAQKCDGDGCWGWSGAFTDNGYGKLGAGGTEIRAHRLSWIIHNGPIPEGLGVLHRCDNPPCVRPDHLFLGTHKDNMADMIRKGRAKFQRKGAK